MTELASGVHLTTSRVNRLLRPLRNKCNSLAAFPKSAAASRVTYSKYSSNWDPDSRPPLAPLHPPRIKKLTLDRLSADEFELSRRIYAVCDAFKNIAHVAYGQPCTQRIPSLAAMCALAIGKNMPTMGLDKNPIGFGGNMTNENDVLDVDGIYEAVPPHYRRFLIVSHALSMVLCICTHHHTLVTVLLDYCLSFGLVHESTRLLDIVLTQAFLPFNLPCLPPATHPDHTSYLLDLHAKWNAGDMPPGASSGPPLFTTSTFCQVVLDVLSQSSPCNSYILWTSEVLNRFLKVVGSCDLDSYISIIYALSQTFGEILNSSQDATQDDAHLAMLGDTLSELMSNLFDLLFNQSDSHLSHSTSSRIYAVIDVLRECYTARLHRLRMSTPGSPFDLPDVVVVFTTHIFVAFRNSIDNLEHLLAILDDSSPVPTTFSKLMVYFCRRQDRQEFGDFIEAFLSQLEMYSSTLRSERLFELDASLWACALHHFETAIASSQKGSSSPVKRYKQQFMEAVDAAERRCFGDMDSSPVTSLSIQNRAQRTRRGRLSGHWEWEDMVGSWIRRTPVRKKQKIDDGYLLNRPRGTVTPVAASGSISAPTHCRIPTLSPTPPAQPSESDGSEYQDGSDKENYHSRRQIVKRLPLAKRRSSNFISLLADAQSNRIILHPKPRPDAKPPYSVVPEKCVPPRSLQDSRHALCKQEQSLSGRKVPPATPSKALLLSDDSLDLFACATSSPARC